MSTVIKVSIALAAGPDVLRYAQGPDRSASLSNVQGRPMPIRSLLAAVGANAAPAYTANGSILGA
jgi:hypothetical protein